MTRLSALSTLLVVVTLMASGVTSSVQVLAQDSEKPAIFTTSFEVSQSVPQPAVVPEAARGAGVFSFNPETKTLTFQISLINLTSSVKALQFHNEATGSAGPPLQTICGEGPAGVVGTPLVEGPCREGVNHTMQQSWELTDQHIAELFAGRIYVNVHTEANFAPGEIRGQLINLNQ